MSVPEPFRSLTPLGRGVLATGVVALALGWWARWQEFVQLGLVALVLVVLGLLWIALPWTPTVDLALHPHRLTDGGERRATARLAASAGGSPVLASRLRVPVGRTEAAVSLPGLRPGQLADVEVELPPLARGVHQVGPAVHERRDVLGLARRAREVSDAELLLVRPRVVDVEQVTGGLTNLDGAVSSRISMSDLSFHALREYVPGDDIRHVHWRSSARTSRLQVRQYHETRRGHVTVLLDHEEHVYPRREDFELAISVATSLALRAVRDDCDTYLRCRDHVASGRSAEAVLDAACWFEPGSQDLGSVASLTLREVPAAGLVALVTGPGRDATSARALLGTFGHDTSPVLLRADTRGTARVGGVRGVGEVVVDDLAGLRRLLRGAVT